MIKVKRVKKSIAITVVFIFLWVAFGLTVEQTKEDLQGQNPTISFHSCGSLACDDIHTITQGYSDMVGDLRSSSMGNSSIHSIDSWQRQKIHDSIFLLLAILFKIAVIPIFIYLSNITRQKNQVFRQLLIANYIMKKDGKKRVSLFTTGLYISLE